MLNRSLSTFMNAFTASDWTMYPFSSQNQQDFKNLLGIYLDAAFFPRLNETDFLQEGWRLEQSELSDPKSPIIFKGVVFNEMKGVFSNPQNLFAEAVQNHLLPSHTYGVVSGGDPVHIPDLTWQQLKDFHSRYYHPSNSQFYTYGNFSLEEHLEQINEQVLRHFEKIDVDTKVPSEPRWSQPVQKQITCRPDPMVPDSSKQTSLAITWLLNDVTDSYEGFVAGVVASLLVDGETAPFYQSLLEANIGSDYAPVVGYDSHKKESSFSIGLQGIRSDSIPEVRDIIHNTIDKVVQSGFDAWRIDAVLHKIELGLKHQTTRFGLDLCINLATLRNHDGCPLEALQINQNVERFKKELAQNPKYLQEKVEQYFQQNQHVLELTMVPDENYEATLKKKEEELLKSKVSTLTDDEKIEIHKKGLELAELQNMKEDLSCLPCIKVSDIDRRVLPELVESRIYNQVPLQTSEQTTNGVTYIRVLCDTSIVPQHLQPYIPLFCNIVTRMGADDYDFKELSQEIESKTGGIAAQPHICQNHSNIQQFEEGIIFSSYCLNRNTSDMLDLLLKIFHRLDLSDTNRLVTLIGMTAADMANSLADSGHRFAMSLASGNLTHASHINEQWNGVSQVTLMKDIAKMSDHSEILTKLRNIAELVLHKDGMRCAVNASPDWMESAVLHVEDFIDRFPNLNASRILQERIFEPDIKNIHIELPFAVNYASQSFRTVPYCHEDFPKLRVLSSLISSKFLHREIREKGGAYGGGCTAANPGVISYFSYRDPNSMKTFSTFDESIRWVSTGSNYTQQDIDEAKLSVFQQLDSPVAPGNKGMTLFQTGVTDQMRQTHREALLGVTKSDISDAAERYLVKRQDNMCCALLGPENSETRGTESWNVKNDEKEYS
ncbi:presequence protease, mitochondrial-like isoform X2 [Tubulanus polymorphus]